MAWWSSRGMLASVVLAGLLCGCGSSEKPTFLQVQLCVENNQGLTTFLNVIKNVARAENMKFIDGSNETLRSYKVFRESNPKFRFVEPVTHIGVEHGDETMLIAGNIQEQSYNIVIGFSEGVRPSEGRKFADTVVGALKQHWPVETVPAGKGAFPMESCKNGVQEGKAR